MNKSAGKICMAKLARVKHQQAENTARGAELLAEEAALLDELAEGETVDMRTGRARAKYQIPPEPKDVTEEERLSVRRLLRDADYKRRAAR